MNDVITIHLHDSPDTHDTINFSLTPIVFVPGMMGSRLRMHSASRIWDPDNDNVMALNWLPFPAPARARQGNRLALSAQRTSAETLTDLSDAAIQQIRKSVALNNIYARTLDASTWPLAGPRTGGAVAGSKVDDYYGDGRNWASVLWRFYGSLLMFMEETLNGNLDRPVYAFGYDWRQSNELSGQQLADFIGRVIAAHPGAEDVIVVTHSMGGLVLRGALLSSPDVSRKIRGVIHGAQPSIGAVVAYRRFFTGMDDAADGPQPFRSEAWFTGIVFGAKSGPLLSLKTGKFITDSSASLFAYNMSACPGGLQLLPTSAYSRSDPAWLASSAPGVDLSDIYHVYRRTDWPGIAGAVVAGQTQWGSDAEKDEGRVVNEFYANLQTAERFHQRVETLFHPNTFALYAARGRTTDTRVELGEFPDSEVAWVNPNPPAPEGAGRKVRAVQTDEGDGTVPAISAACPSAALAIPACDIGPAEHQHIYNSATTRHALLECIKILLGTRPGAAVAPIQSGAAPADSCGLLGP